MQKRAAEGDVKLNINLRKLQSSERVNRNLISGNQLQVPTISADNPPIALVLTALDMFPLQTMNLQTNAKRKKIRFSPGA